jgi:hypothetical protein
MGSSQHTLDAYCCRTTTDFPAKGTGTRPFSREEGPFVQALDEALSSFNVQRQAYYGGKFIGNHVHCTLKVKYTHVHVHVA